MFYSKDEAAKFNKNIASNNNSKSLECKTILVGNASVDEANIISRSVTFDVPLRYLNNFWRILEMLLINCKVESKLKWSNQCVSPANDNENTDADPNDIIFTIKETKLYAHVVALSAKNN